jgi:hypothetical protein
MATTAPPTSTYDPASETLQRLALDPAEGLACLHSNAVSRLPDVLALSDRVDASTRACNLVVEAADDSIDALLTLPPFHTLTQLIQDLPE